MSAEKKPSGWMRAELPNVAAIVDQFREVFGAESIDDGLRQSMRDGSFYAEDFVTGNKVAAKHDEVVLASGVSGDGLRWAHVKQVSK